MNLLKCHNHEHALQVARNSIKISDNKYILYLAFLHVVCDHKYSNSIPRIYLANFIDGIIPDYKIIDDLIERVSFSEQQKEDIHNDVLNAVRDGDRIEALGNIGIKRCEQITKIRNGKIPEDVIIHCFDKLSRLLPENYIITPIGRSMAVDKHNIIVKYVIDNLPKTNLMYKSPSFLRI